MQAARIMNSTRPGLAHCCPLGNDCFSSIQRLKGCGAVGTNQIGSVWTERRRGSCELLALEAAEDGFLPINASRMERSAIGYLSWHA